MALSIESLRLIPRDVGLDELSHIERVIADAQLAKAAYGFRDWLERLMEMQLQFTPRSVMEELRDEVDLALEQANIKRPTVSS